MNDKQRCRVNCRGKSDRSVFGFTVFLGHSIVPGQSHPTSVPISCVVRVTPTYHGLVKPKEARHDADLYKLYQQVARDIEDSGGRVRRVVLDFELKKELYKSLSRMRPDKDPRYERIFIANQFDLKVVDGMPEYLRPLVTFLYFTGCRIEGALAITWSQIEFEKGRLQLRIEGNQTKNEEPILLPLPLELNEIRKKMSRKGRVFDARNLRKSFQATCVKVELGVTTGPKVWQYKGLLLHDFSGSGVRNLIRSGVPRRIAMKISGHLTESTFERYNIVVSTDLHEARAKVEKYFDGNLMEVEQNQQQDRQQMLSFQ